MNINGLDPILSSGSLPMSTVTAKETKGAGFGDILRESIAAVNQKGQEAAAMSSGLISGQHSNIHETMIALEESNVSFRMLAKAQSKVIDAYKEIMRLQL